jgi:transcriptional regulator with XRE-family HTH domain
MDTTRIFLKCADNHRQLRIDKGFSVEALAVLSGVDEEVISGFEAGNFDFPVRFLFELAETLNVEMSEIFVGSSIYD